MSNSFYKNLIIKFKNITGLNLIKSKEILEKHKFNIEDAIKEFQSSLDTKTKITIDNLVKSFNIFGYFEINQQSHFIKISTDSDFTIKTQEVRDCFTNIFNDFIKNGQFNHKYIEQLKAQCKDNINYQVKQIDVKDKCFNVYCHSIIKEINMNNIIFKICRGISFISCCSENDKNLIYEACLDVFDLNTENIDFLKENSNSFKLLKNISEIILLI